MSEGAPFDIVRHIDGGHGRFVLSHDGAAAELTFSVAGETLWIADHTQVDDALKGTGAGQALGARLVADARAEGRKIVPLCPFVNAQRRKHPEWADAFQV